MIEEKHEGDQDSRFTLWSEKHIYKDADKSLARPGRKQATTEDFDVHITYLY